MGALSAPAHLYAPAKLTRSLAVLGVRPDGYHELRAEMVALDLADELVVDPAGAGLHIEALDGVEVSTVPTGPDNLVLRALERVGAHAGVHLRKRIPAGAGLGGGSADAGAILRWAGRTDPALSSELGADVPFCVQGGRALVEGIGERVTPLAFVEQSFVLLLVPFGVSTAACFAAFDEIGVVDRGAGNDLVAPALAIEPRLAGWRDRLGELSGATPKLAGSGSTWFVEGSMDELGLEAGPISLDGEVARLVGVRSVPGGWAGPIP